MVFGTIANWFAGRSEPSIPASRWPPPNAFQNSTMCSGRMAVSVGKDQQCASLKLGDVGAPVKGAFGQVTDLPEEVRPIDIGIGLP